MVIAEAFLIGYSAVPIFFCMARPAIIGAGFLLFPYVIVPSYPP